MNWVFAIVIGIVAQLLGGLVLSNLWAWFVTPVFPIPAPGYLRCVGLMFTASFFMVPAVVGIATAMAKDHREQEPYAIPVVMLVIYSLSWAFGAAWHLAITVLS